MSRRRLNILLAREKAVPVEHSLPEQSKTVPIEKGKQCGNCLIIQDEALNDSRLLELPGLGKPSSAASSW